MDSRNDYFIATGEVDRQRLALLNKLYNPGTFAFLLQSGLQSGMKILEIGCGTGQMACWLAQKVMPKGHVIACDNSPEQLRIAEQTAKEKGISNIEFIARDIRELETLNERFDLIYGRAVIEFITQGRREIVNQLYASLNSSGLLIYEALSAIQDGHFSCPHQTIVDQFFLMNNNYALASHLASDFPSELYRYYHDNNCQNIEIKVNQPVLCDSYKKSFLRLGAISTRHTVYQDFSDLEFKHVLQELKKLECDNQVIIGFYRCLLIKGQKP